MAATLSFTQFYLQYFGDRRHSHIDLLPELSAEDQRQHTLADDRFSAAVELKKAAEDFDKCIHTCWCNPELIFADDTKGNEVWLHKRVQ